MRNFVLSTSWYVVTWFRGTLQKKHIKYKDIYDLKSLVDHFCRWAGGVKLIENNISIRAHCVIFTSHLVVPKEIKPINSSKLHRFHKLKDLQH